LVALPALRLAFTYFTPREKHAIARTLVQAWDAPDATSPALLDLDVAPEEIARAKAVEATLLEALARYGLRGGSRESIG
ncbi:MAG: hypothetical protein WCD18_23090, partial [Thermosynechococcaceae cyanobacterium]